ncbi:hypothetical protein RYA05_01325 [Pseudomonas syringae pv. actinidiae]|uniref:hypothetical protein n=1 Tax=Pseudomonas viridiflava TaxID=33069 RepID=UPI0018E5F195|nr:hypothetical protein [Pseudomonas viridiflava]MBI6725671.1 hypothetical protein [Pseudomonas viridiflava]MDU8350525.1 hypothetical protein [Pseudomonas syringae pv. actinidiae]
MKLVIKNEDGSMTESNFSRPAPSIEQAKVISDYSYLVGTKYTNELCKIIAKDTGREVRPTGNRLVTMDVQQERLNLDISSEDIITKLFFG